MSARPTGFAWVALDLGGVLAPLGGRRWFRERAPALRDDEIDARWSAIAEVAAYERGDVDDRAFAGAVLAAFGLCRSQADAFLDDYASWCTGFFPWVDRLLRRVAVRHRLAALSNVSPVHAATLRRQAAWRRFSDHLLSFEIGLTKPDARLFAALIERLGVQPRRILYCDDRPENVAAARAAGIAARLTPSRAGLVRALRDADALSDAACSAVTRRRQPPAPAPRPRAPRGRAARCAAP